MDGIQNKLSLQDLAKLAKPSHTQEKPSKTTDDYKFWKTQPVPRLGIEYSNLDPKVVAKSNR